MQSFIRSNVSINNFNFIIIFKHFEFKYTCTHALSYYEHKLVYLPEKGVPYMSLTNANCHILTLVNN